MDNKDEDLDEGYGEGDPRAKLGKVQMPDDFASEHEFIADMRKSFQMSVDYDFDNRQAAIEDAEFLVGEQWDETMLADRTREGKPSLVVNRLIAFIGQIVGNRRQSQTVIKIIPDNGGSKLVAEKREGMIRSIQKVSKASRWYTLALQNAAIGGIGNFKITLDYASDDVFEQDITVRGIPNPLAVVWDYASFDPTGADARFCFEIETITKDEFTKRYPGKQVGDIGLDTTYAHDAFIGGWITAEDVRIVNYWRMRQVPRILALMKDGSVVDVTDLPLEQFIDNVQLRKSGEPIMRESMRSYAEMYVCSGNDVLEGPYRLPIRRVPIFRVPGWEVDVGERRVRFGVVRFLKDPQRMHNYWRSVIVEKLMLTPKAPWVASETAVQGREEMWKNAHLSNDMLLIYNSDGQAPTRTPPAQIEAALIQEANMTAQDLRDVSNMHEASLGMVSNEVSGRGITARQRVSELGMTVYFDNLDMSIEEAGQVMNDLFPVVYDTPRVVKLLGEDDKLVEMLKINDPDDEASVDITVGKYVVTAIAGPNYATKRAEATEGMMAMVNTMPQTMAVAADKIVEAQDWPGQDEIAARLKSQLPPGMVPDDELPPEVIQARQAQAQKAAQMEQLQMSLLVAQLAKEQATARELMSRAMKAESEIGVDAAKVEMGLMQQRIDALDALLGRAFEIVKFEKEVEAGERQTTFQETKTIADMLMRTGV